MIEVEKVIAVGVFVPFDLGESFVIANVGVAEAAMSRRAT